MTADDPSVHGSVAEQAVAMHRDGLVVQDATGSVVAFNDAALDVLGVTESQLRGSTSFDPRWRAVRSDHSELAGDDHPAVICLRTGRPVVGVELGVHRPDGSVRWLQVSSYPVDVDGGRGVVTWFADVTPRRTAIDTITFSLDRLQAALLPTRLPAVPGVDLAARYRAAGPTLQVGGDFYDIFPVSESRWGFFIGDVCGHDVSSVSPSLLARHTLRAAGLHLQRPDRVLAWLHDALAATEQHTYCTAVFGWLEPHDDVVDVAFAVGGHPLPVIARADGTAFQVGTHGRLLGLVPLDGSLSTTEVTLDAGDRLVLYTDGLIDSPRPRRSDADVVAVASGRWAASADLVDVLFELGPVGEAQHDDTAVLVIGATGSLDDSAG